ncbi:MAG: myo-inosose-2 dehydratase, partial [Clostridiaceae bacterium]|nr:myo-inosose-2 dehydratase [Clostridiaceae bacterium]
MFKDRNIKLGISPLGWTNDDMPHLGADIPFEQSIKEMTLAGFEGTEVGNKFPKDPFELNATLKKYNLKIASQWFSSFLCETSYEENEKRFVEQLDYLESVGANLINVCELTRNLFAVETSMFGNDKPIASDDEWELLCSGLNKLGTVA